MNVAVLCEFSGVVREAFRARGHNAVSYDLLPSEQPGPHVQGDVREADLSWADLVIAHPPCTRLCNSGVRWLHRPPTGKSSDEMWRDMRKACEFFQWCRAQGRMNATENPVMHGHAMDIVGDKPTFTVQPWQFGDNFKKRTCFWTRGLPPLIPTSALDGSMAVAEVHRASPGPDRWAKRSKTYQGIAAAMADQWGRLEHPCKTCAR